MFAWLLVVVLVIIEAVTKPPDTDETTPVLLASEPTPGTPPIFTTGGLPKCEDQNLNNSAIQQGNITIDVVSGTLKRSINFPDCIGEEEVDDVEFTEIFLDMFWKQNSCGTGVCFNVSDGDCYCDNACYFYGDCCYVHAEKDYSAYIWIKGGNSTMREMIDERTDRYLSQATPYLRSIVHLQQCVAPLNESVGYWMVNRCPNHYNGSVVIRHKCESVTYYDYTNLPVDYVLNGSFQYSFTNVFCALCNGIQATDLKYWSMELLCKTNQPITPDTLMEDMLELCPANYFSNFMGHLRACQSLVKETIQPLMPLNATDIDETFWLFCRSYILPISALNSTSIPPDQVYRNPHCAVMVQHSDNYSQVVQNDCLVLDDMQCAFATNSRYSAEETESKSGANVFNPVNLKVLFEFDIDNGVSLNLRCIQKSACETYEIYDCVTSKCRQLYCDYGLVPLNGQCISIPGSKNEFYQMPGDNSDEQSFILEITADECFKSIDITDICSYVLTDFTKSPDGACKSIHEAQSGSIYYLHVRIDALQNLSFSSAIDVLKDIADEVSEELKKQPDDEEDKKEDDEKGKDSDVNVTNKPDENKDKMFSMSIRNFVKSDDLLCRTNELIVDYSATIDEESDVILYSVYNMFVPTNVSRWDMTVTKQTTTLNMSATCASIFALTDLNCSMVVYNISEVVLQNKSDSIKIADRSFKTGDYFVLKDKVFVCAELVGPTLPDVDIFEYMEHYTILTYVTSSISIVCLLAVIVHHMMDKKLRNIHGLNITAMATVILLIHVLLVIQTLVKIDTLCIAYAIVLHFLLLNMFSWMNVIGIDMARIFASGTMVSKRSPGQRFVKHIALSLLATLIVMITVCVLEFATDFPDKPNYGKNGVCWLTNGLSVVFFVIVPVGASLLVSFISFTITVRCLFVQVHETKLATSINNKKYFLVYMKLAIILGLTWIIGLLGAFVRTEWLWIVHIVLNGLQGLSLLACAVVNKRVITKLKSTAKYLTTDSGSKPDNTILNSKSHREYNGHSNGSPAIAKHNSKVIRSSNTEAKAFDASDGYVLPQSNNSSPIYEVMDGRSHDESFQTVTTGYDDRNDVYVEADSINNCIYSTDM